LIKSAHNMNNFVSRRTPWYMQMVPGVFAKAVAPHGAPCVG